MFIVIYSSSPFSEVKSINVTVQKTRRASLAYANKVARGCVKLDNSWLTTAQVIDRQTGKLISQYGRANDGGRIRKEV